jgi:hypothetical protein
LMTEAIYSSEKSVLTRATWRNTLKDGILHSHCHENIKSYKIWNYLQVHVLLGGVGLGSPVPRYPFCLQRTFQSTASKGCYEGHHPAWNIQTRYKINPCVPL